MRPKANWRLRLVTSTSRNCTIPAAAADYRTHVLEMETVDTLCISCRTKAYYDVYQATDSMQWCMVD